MRIVIYKDVLTSGRGADRATVALANALSQRGHSVYFVTEAPQGGVLSRRFAAGVQVQLVVGPPRSGLRWWIYRLLRRRRWGDYLLRRFLPGCDWGLRISQQLHCLLERFSPEVVVSAGSNELVTLFAAGVLPWPVVQMFHIYPPVDFARRDVHGMRFRAAMRQVAAAQVLLPSFQALVERWTSAPVAVIANAVAFAQEVPKGPRKRQIAYVAYFAKDKNHEALLRAFAKLQRAEAWSLELYGSGTPVWEQRLRQWIAELGIAERVHLRGVTENPSAVFAESAICAYPSLVEGFGIALVEAMGMGTACVGFADAPGVNELLEDGRTGLLAAPGAEAFGVALQRLIDDEALRVRLGQAAAETVREAYEPAHIWQAWEKLLTSVVNPSQAQKLNEK